MTELTIPILLSSVSNQPLSVLIFSAYEQGTAVAPYAVAVLQLVAVLATLGLVFGVSRRLRRTLTRQ
jgi:ABC-type spermidine/putrescine transport system permease subunit II